MRGQRIGHATPRPLDSAQREPSAALNPASQLQRFAQLSQRLFNVPLVIHPRKAEVVVAALAERLGIMKIQRLEGNIIVPMAFSDDDDNDFTSPTRSQEHRVGYENLGGVALIEVSGTLVNKLGTVKPYSGMTGYDGIRQNFLSALTDPAVRGIALDVESPGGEVSGCFDLVDTIYKARGQKPIWAILSEYAYSGGYAIASAADKIFVPRTGGAGSVGVICMHCDFSKAIEAQGVVITILQYGDSKSDGYPEVPLTKAARERFQADIDAMGQIFDETVARNRGLAASTVKSYQAQTFMGANAVGAKLCDAVMAPDAAFRDIVKSLGTVFR